MTAHRWCLRCSARSAFGAPYEQEQGKEESMNTGVDGRPTVRLIRRMRAMRDDRGAATAEYAIATLAAVGFAGLLVAILRSDEVRGMLLDLVHRALTFGS